MLIWGKRYLRIFAVDCILVLFLWCKECLFSCFYTEDLVFDYTVITSCLFLFLFEHSENNKTKAKYFISRFLSILCYFSRSYVYSPKQLRTRRFLISLSLWKKTSFNYWLKFRKSLVIDLVYLFRIDVTRYPLLHNNNRQINISNCSNILFYLYLDHDKSMISGFFFFLFFSNA